MKKAIIAILAVFYLTMTTGVLVNIHYCMGEVASVEYGHEDHGPCEKCGMEDKEGCCHTEHKLIKADNDHVAFKNFTEISGWIAEVPLFYLTEIATTYQPVKVQLPPYNSPPDIRSNELCLYNSVFRI